MALSNTALRYYDSNVLRLPADKRKEYHEQVDRLITELCRSIRNQTSITITKVVKAGSFAKYTILRKTAVDPVDVDVVFYIAGKDVDHETLQSLNDTIYELLIKQYPTKSVEDFQIQRKAATVTFVGTGLSVDIVPVIEDPDRPGYGWQYDLETGERADTCAPGQIKFVRDRKNADGDFRTLVRMAKKWRNHNGITKLKSFTIELRFRNFLLYIAQTGLKDEISFPENALPLGDFDDPVVILDPVASQNNVASRLSEAERQEIVAAADAAWETACFAAAENDNDVWKEIFGPRFKTED
jgi:tRNA nucleotidyltransferase (CCA-adding enzyme)